MKVTRRRGTVHLKLEPAEAALLVALFDDLGAVLDGDVMDEYDPVRQRLFPIAYPQDEIAADEFRDLTEPSLRSERTDRARQCAAELSAGNDVGLDQEAGERWIKALNDLRLTLGTRLNITEDDDHEQVDPQDSDAQSRVVYLWMTAVQDTLVRALSA